MAQNRTTRRPSCLAAVPLRRVLYAHSERRLDRANSVFALRHGYAASLSSMVRARLGSSTSVGHVGTAGRDSTGMEGYDIMDQTGRRERRLVSYLNVT